MKWKSAIWGKRKVSRSERSRSRIHHEKSTMKCGFSLCLSRSSSSTLSLFTYIQSSFRYASLVTPRLEPIRDYSAKNHCQRFMKFEIEGKREERVGEKSFILNVDAVASLSLLVAHNSANGKVFNLNFHEAEMARILHGSIEYRFWRWESTPTSLIQNDERSEELGKKFKGAQERRRRVKFEWNFKWLSISNSIWGFIFKASLNFVEWRKLKINNLNESVSEVWIGIETHSPNRINSTNHNIALSLTRL